MMRTGPKPYFALLVCLLCAPSAAQAGAARIGPAFWGPGVAVQATDQGGDLPLAVDPLLVFPPLFATYLGGSGSDTPRHLSTDAAGNIYVIGETDSADFPTPTPGAAPGTGGLYVVKLDPTGRTLLYTFLGIAGTVDAAVVDPGGSVYLTGRTTAADLPLVNPVDDTPGNDTNGGYDCYVARLSASGALLFSTYLSGSASDRCVALAVDVAGNAYVAGWTYSTDFPIRNALYPSSTGSATAFLAKIGPLGAPMAYATFLPGARSVLKIATAEDGSAVVAGEAGPGLPLVHPVQEAISPPATHGPNDLFVARLDPAGSALTFSTYFGCSGREDLAAMRLHANGEVTIAGRAECAGLPVVGPSAAGFHGVSDVFVATLNTTEHTLVWSTYLGGSVMETTVSAAWDESGATYLTGSTDSADFPTLNAYDASLDSPVRHGVFNGSGDCFAARIDRTGTLSYATFLGGSASELCSTLTVGRDGSIAIGGTTYSVDFPFVGAFDATCDAGLPSPESDRSCGGFVARISPAGGLLFSSLLGGPAIRFGPLVALDAAGNLVAAAAVYGPGLAAVEALDPTFGPNDLSYAGDVYLMKIAADPVENVAPVAAADRYSVARGGTLRIDAPGVLANDTPSDSWPLLAAKRTAPPANGSLTLAPDGSFTYVHEVLPSAADAFAYVADSHAQPSAPATVGIDVLPADSLIFSDDFSGGPGARWVTKSGTWASPAEGTFGCTSRTGPNLAQVEPAFLGPRSVGRIEARVRLGPGTAPNARLVFSLQGNGDLRYVELLPGRARLVQVRTFRSGETSILASGPAAVRAGRWHHVRIDLQGSGVVQVSVDGVLALSGRFAPAADGGVGLGAVRAEALFDNVSVFDRSALP
jgi:hypothetical protein